MPPPQGGEVPGKNKYETENKKKCRKNKEKKSKAKINAKKLTKKEDCRLRAVKEA